MTKIEAQKKIRNIEKQMMESARRCGGFGGSVRGYSAIRHNGKGDYIAIVEYGENWFEKALAVAESKGYCYKD
jgi:hypothetical protein